jgi:hypothetical protein
VSAVAAVAVSDRKVRLLFPATSGEALAERTPVSAMLERVLRYPDGTREQRRELGLVRR